MNFSNAIGFFFTASVTGIILPFSAVQHFRTPEGLQTTRDCPKEFLVILPQKKGQPATFDIDKD
jgi:hypothetical protein